MFWKSIVYCYWICLKHEEVYPGEHEIQLCANNLIMKPTEYIKMIQTNKSNAPKSKAIRTKLIELALIIW